MYQRLDGVDHLFSVRRTSDRSGQACFHYKRHGEVEISSPCSEKVRLARGKGRSSTCPRRINSMLITTEAPKPRHKCTPVKLTVPVTLRDRCPEPDIANGIRIGNDFSFGAEVTFECDRFFYLTGDYRRICLECGRWSGTKAYCQRSHLPPPKPISPTFGPYAQTASTQGPNTGTNNTLQTEPSQTNSLTLSNDVPNPTQP